MPVRGRNDDTDVEGGATDEDREKEPGPPVCKLYCSARLDGCCKSIILYVYVCI